MKSHPVILSTSHAAHRPLHSRPKHTWACLQAVFITEAPHSRWGQAHAFSRSTSSEELLLQGDPINFQHPPNLPPTGPPLCRDRRCPYLLDQIHIILPSRAARFPLLKLSGPTFRQSGVIIHGAPVTNDGAPLFGGGRSFWDGWG